MVNANRFTSLLYSTLIALVFGVLGSFAVSGRLAATDDIKIVAFGDSLTAGYGLGPGEGFVDQLQAYLTEKAGLNVDITNAGVSGDTSTGGRSRLDWAIAGVAGGQPDLVILTLGGNDGLRGVDPDVTRDNMDAMIKQLKARNIPVLIGGMQAPPNLGPDYAAKFNSIFPDMAKKYQVALYPFFLEGVAADPALNQADGIHPTSEGVAIIVDQMGPVVANLIKGGS